MAIDLAKKHLIDLSKKAETAVVAAGLGDQKAITKAVFDTSYSMISNYSSGEVQETAERILGLAMKFDDNQELDVLAFDTKPHSIGVLNENNFYGYVNKNIRPLVGGGTIYSPMLKAIMADHGVSLDGTKPLEPIVKEKRGFRKFFGKKTTATPAPVTGTKAPFDQPVFSIVITDGDNSIQDYKEAERVIRESAKYGFFWKFVGIGDENFAFLKRLDDLEDRLIDNADFFQVIDIQSISEEALYKELLKEFPEWVQGARRLNLIK